METQQSDNLLSDVPDPATAVNATPCVKAPAAPPVASDPIQKRLSELVHSSRTRADLDRSLVELLGDQTRLLGLWSVKATGEQEADSTPQSVQVRSLIDPGFGDPGTATSGNDALWEAITPLAAIAIRESSQSGEIAGLWFNDRQEQSIVVSPLAPITTQQSTLESVAAGRANEQLVACFASPDQSMLRQQWLLGMVCQSVGSWNDNRKNQLAQTQNQRLQETIALMHEACGGADRLAASITIVNRLKTMLCAAQVSIASISSKNSCRLQAVSDVDQPDISSPVCSEINSALQRDWDCAATYALTENPNADGDASLAAPKARLRRYCDATGTGSVVNVAIPGESGLPVAALLVSFDAERIGPETISLIERMAALLAPVIELTHRANRSAARQISESLKPRRLLRPAGLMFLAACLLMLVPAPYRMACDCRLQPVLRRFVVAPYDGILEKTLVKVGEVVTEGQMIARMDGRERQIRLAGLQAEYDGARRKRESAMAKREVAQSQIAASEMRSLQAQIQLIEDQMKDLEVRSPIAGMVIVGDLEKAQGAPLEAGQTLFEIAPLSSMVAEVQIPESEIRYVNSDNPVAIKLNAFPFRTFEGTVGSIHPDSEIVDGQTVFIAEMELSNEDISLKPGMEGSAKIQTHWSPIGWNLFHKAWESARYWTLW